MKLFPIKKGAKFPPLVKDWEHRASDDSAQIEAWTKEFPGCNWGIACGPSNLIVVDEDAKGALLALELDDVLDFPPTREVKTPKGRHLYYIGHIRGSIKRYPGVDIKSAGGYVLAPGSRIQTGIYELVRDVDPVDPDPRLLVCAPPTSAPDPIPTCELDSPAAVLRAKEYADFQAEPSIQGEGGDANCYRVACRMRDIGVSQNTCLEILAGRWNDRCEPPWEIDELEDKVRNAYRYAREAPGNADPTCDFDELPDEQPSEPQPFRLQDLTGDPKPREWVVNQWLPLGEVTSLYGDGGQGKSTLAGQLAVAAAYGVPWLGMDTRQMPVLCVMAEDDRDEVHRRMNACRQAMGLDFSSADPWLQFYAYPSEDYTIAAFTDKDQIKIGRLYSRLCGWLDNMPAGHKLLVLDTLADIFAGNENIRAQANRFVKIVLRGLGVKYDATILLLAHPSRAGISGEDLLSGSTAWNNAVRNRLALTSHKEIPDARVLVRVKSNYARSGERMLLEYNAGVFVARDEADMFGSLVDEHAEAILRMLRSAVDEGKPFGDSRNHPRPLSKCLPFLMNGDGKTMKRETLERIINQLVDDGRLERVQGKPRGNGLFPL